MHSEIYTDTQGQWRWRLVADDTGTTIAGAGTAMPTTPIA